MTTVELQAMLAKRALSYCMPRVAGKSNFLDCSGSPQIKLFLSLSTVPEFGESKPPKS